MDNYVFIDPSVNNIGVAVFTPKGDLQDYYEIKTNRNLDWRERVRESKDLLLNNLKRLVGSFRLIIETPIYFSGGRGKYAYAGEKVQKLYYSVAFLAGWFESAGISVEEVLVSDARQNLPKSVTQRRVEKVFGQISESEHVLDAVYMGMWYGKKIGLWDLTT